MTYAGLKSMIYAGLSRDDPRVKAVLSYIIQHYTVDENPGLAQSVQPGVLCPVAAKARRCERTRTPPYPPATAWAASMKWMVRKFRFLE